MNYLRFLGWLMFMTWVIADGFPRYVLPRLAAVYDALEELAAGGWGTKRFGAGLSLAVQIPVSFSLAYIFTIWSAWCVLMCMAYTQDPAGGRFLYYITAFFCCEYALGKMAKADRHRGFFMSILPFVMPMGAFVVFAMNPLPLEDAYPWLMRWMGIVF